MPRIRVPKNVGPYHILVASAGNYAVWNRRRGKNKVYIVCRDRAHAEEICQRLNGGEHGEMWM
jgi:hypothetical protein